MRFSLQIDTIVLTPGMAEKVKELGGLATQVDETVYLNFDIPEATDMVDAIDRATADVEGAGYMVVRVGSHTEDAEAFAAINHDIGNQ